MWPAFSCIAYATVIIRFCPTNVIYITSSSLSDSDSGTPLAADVLFILLNLALSPYLSPTWIIAGDMLLWIMLNILITQLIRSRERVQGVRLYE